MVFLTTKQQMRLYLLPIGLSLAGALLHFWPLLALAVPAVFVLAGTMPICSGRESLWIFLASVPTSVPLNLFLIRLLARTWIAAGFVRTRMDGVLWGTLVFFTLLSLEEIWLLLLSRAIWTQQDDDEKIRRWIEDDKSQNKEGAE